MTNDMFGRPISIGSFIVHLTSCVNTGLRLSVVVRIEERTYSTVLYTEGCRVKTVYRPEERAILVDPNQIPMHIAIDQFDDILDKARAKGYDV